jgi:hypothetical protein
MSNTEQSQFSGSSPAMRISFPWEMMETVLTAQIPRQQPWNLKVVAGYPFAGGSRRRTIVAPQPPYCGWSSVKETT